MGSNMPSTVMNNNFLNNTYNVYLRTSVNIDAINNWWGTTDQQAINQTIHDNKNDYNGHSKLRSLPDSTQPKCADPNFRYPRIPSDHNTNNQPYNVSSNSNTSQKKQVQKKFKEGNT